MPELEESEAEDDRTEAMVNPLFLGPVGKKTPDLSADSEEEGFEALGLLRIQLVLLRQRDVP